MNAPEAELPISELAWLDQRPRDERLPVLARHALRCFSFSNDFIIHSHCTEETEKVALRAARLCIALCTNSANLFEDDVSIKDIRVLSSENSAQTTGMLFRHPVGMSALNSIISAFEGQNDERYSECVRHSLHDAAEVSPQLPLAFAADVDRLRTGDALPHKQKALDEASEEATKFGLHDHVLWPEHPIGVSHFDTPKRHGPWEFWRSWHKSFFHGVPIDWGLQRQISMIDGEIWNAGPKIVAHAIDNLLARWEVEKALRELKDHRRVQSATRHGIGGNNPPESIKEKSFFGSVTLLWEATEELSEALEQENPEREWVEKILEKLKTGFLALAKWIGRKADLAVDSVIVTAIKQSGPLVGGYYALDKLIKAIEDWLPYLP